MNIEPIAHASLAPAGGPGAAVQAGYGLSFTDLGQFNQALQAAGQARIEAHVVEAPSPITRMALEPLQQLNGEADSLRDLANRVLERGVTLTPAELVGWSVRVHEYSFHCNLTSNAANRASDGLAQLFRQQS